MGALEREEKGTEIIFRMRGSWLWKEKDCASEPHGTHGCHPSRSRGKVYEESKAQQKQRKGRPVSLFPSSPPSFCFYVHFLFILFLVIESQMQISKIEADVQMGKRFQCFLLPGILDS